MTKIGPGSTIEFGPTPGGVTVHWYMGFDHKPHIAILTPERDRISFPPEEIEPLVALLVAVRSVK